MKTSRALLSLFAAMILPIAALAADATVASVKNTAVTITPTGAREPVKTGRALEDGAIIETGDNSAITIKLSDGSSITLGANSRVRIKFKSGLLRLTLFRGVIVGNFAPGATVTTPGGIAQVGGGSAAVQYKTTTVGAGTLTVAAGTKGVALTLTDGKTTRAIPPGNMLTIEPNGSPTPGNLTPEALANINQGTPFDLLQKDLEDNTRRGNPGQVQPPAKPDTTKITKISPNGE